MPKPPASSIRVQTSAEGLCAVVRVRPFSSFPETRTAPTRPMRYIRSSSFRVIHAAVRRARATISPNE